MVSGEGGGGNIRSMRQKWSPELDMPLSRDSGANSHFELDDGVQLRLSHHNNLTPLLG